MHQKTSVLSFTNSCRLCSCLLVVICGCGTLFKTLTSTFRNPLGGGTVAVWVGAASSNLSFFGHRPKWFWNDRKKSSHFGQNVWKYGLKCTVTASFNTTVRQMTEMFQWPKCLNEIWPKYLNKIWPKCLSERKQLRTALTAALTLSKVKNASSKMGCVSLFRERVSSRVREIRSFRAHCCFSSFPFCAEWGLWVCTTRSGCWKSSSLCPTTSATSKSGGSDESCWSAR